MMAMTTVLLLQVQLDRSFEGVSFVCLLLQEGSSLQAMLIFGSRDVHAWKETGSGEDMCAAGQSWEQHFNASCIWGEGKLQKQESVTVTTRVYKWHGQQAAKL